MCDQTGDKRSTVHAEHGIKAACEVSGRPADATLRLINHRPATNNTFTAEIRSFDD